MLTSSPVVAYFSLLEYCPRDPTGSTPSPGTRYEYLLSEVMHLLNRPLVECFEMGVTQIQVEKTGNADPVKRSVAI
jgi:hypothetical protein